MLWTTRVIQYQVGRGCESIGRISGSLCLLLTVLDVLVEHHLLPVMAAGVASILLTAVFAYALLKLTVYKDLETKSS